MLFNYERTAEPTDEDYEPQELTDADLLKAWEASKKWLPEGESIDSFIGAWDEEYVQEQAEVPDLFPSQFTEFAFRMPHEDGTYKPFSFEGRRHMFTVYNTPAKRVLLCCGRQVEKSTYVGNIILTYSCMIPAFKTLYVSPSATQTKTFSTDRIKDPIETSNVLRTYTTNMLSQNVFEKQFTNRSIIRMRYAFLNPDRTRGIPAYMLALDELQDILADNIPVIEQCTSHAPEKYKRFLYTGTPKGLDNPIEYYRSQLSTQGEWVVPCDAHGGDTGRYWNVLGEKNIQRHGLSCEKCGKLINPMHQDAQWANMVEWHPQKTPFVSFRIPQLMVPWKAWDEILLDYQRYTRDKFYNEVLGISFDSGLRPLTLGQIKQFCRPEVTMHPDYIERLRKHLLDREVFAGIDWGTGENSYTVMTLAYYEGTKFRVFWVHRFVGEDTDPQVQARKIIAILRAFKVRICGTDYGGGFDRNNILVRAFGPQRIQKFQYMARCKKKVFFDGKLNRWQVHRTEVMSDLFTAIKRGHFEFPRWEEFKDPYAQDMANIFSEYNEALRMIQYQHSPDQPDDTFHSILYCFLGSMIVRPRPDIIAPRREFEHQGAVLGGYSGPINQG